MAQNQSLEGGLVNHPRRLRLPQATVPRLLDALHGLASECLLLCALAQERSLKGACCRTNGIFVVIRSISSGATDAEVTENGTHRGGGGTL
jgi:hypothetical protein